MRVLKKNHAYTKSPNSPAPSVVSKLKWLVPNIQVPKKYVKVPTIGEVS